MSFLHQSELFQRLFLNNYQRTRQGVIRIRHDKLFTYVIPVTNIAPEHPWTDVAYRQIGNGPEKVVFIPGMCVSSAMWHRQAALLSKYPEYSLLLVDNRGSGGSSMAQEGFDTGTMARDAWGVVDVVFGRESRVHVVGHSMGSMIAQRVAIFGNLRGGGERVKSLSLLSGHEGGWFWSRVPSGELMRAGFELAKGRFEEKVTAEVYMKLHYTERYLSGVEEGVLRRNKYFKRYLEGIRSDRKVIGREALFWRHLDAVRGHQLSREDVGTLQKGCYPKLVIYGKEDVVVLPRASRELADRIGAQALGVNGAHFMVEEAAEEVTDLLRLQFDRAQEMIQQGEEEGVVHMVMRILTGSTKWDEHF